MFGEIKSGSIYHMHGQGLVVVLFGYGCMVEEELGRGKV